MYCTKCGKKANPGDRFCAGCGNKLGTAAAVEVEKSGGGFGKMVVMILAILALTAVFVGREDARQKQLQEQARWGEAATESIAPPMEEKSYYADGGLHKTIRFYENGRVQFVEERDGEGHVIQTENYWENGNIQLIVQYSYSGDALQDYTSYTYDEMGNIISFTQQYADGTVYNCYYYSYRYDSQGRILEMTNFNQNGVLMQEESRVYHADGSYTRDYTEYRGANTYDWEFDMEDPDVANKWYHAVIECDAQGNELDVRCDFSDGYPQEG